MSLQKFQRTESFLVRCFLIATTIFIIGILILLPLIFIFIEAFSKGVTVYGKALTHPAFLSALHLTLLCTVVAVFLNTIFGLCSGWLLGKFNFLGKRWMITLIDLPISISPVVAGLMILLQFGPDSYLGQLLEKVDIQIIFAVPGVIIATLFVTLPYISRELTPLMQQQGIEEEEAARLLGGNGWQIFSRITLRNIKWSLFYGILICSARAIGEFGAVSVVSGHIRGKTNTIPLHVEILYNEYDLVGAFAAASTLTFIAIITIIMKSWLERWISK